MNKAIKSPHVLTPLLFLFVVILYGIWSLWVTLTIAFWVSVVKHRVSLLSYLKIQKPGYMPTQFFFPCLLLSILFIIIAYRGYDITSSSYIPLGETLEFKSSDYETTRKFVRVSCDSVDTTITRQRIDVSILISKRLNYTNVIGSGIISYDTTTLTSKSTPEVNRTHAYLPLVVKGVSCGDTIVTKKYKPYYDRNYNIIQVTKKYLNKKWALDSSTTYINKSPKIPEHVLAEVFEGMRAFWTHTTRVKKFTLRMLDESKEDTLDNLYEAKSLLDTKCKKKATALGKLLYTEYMACKNSNIVKNIITHPREYCGVSPVRLSYSMGVTVIPPPRCNSSAEWEEMEIYLRKRTGINKKKTTTTDLS